MKRHLLICVLLLCSILSGCKSTDSSGESDCDNMGVTMILSSQLIETSQEDFDVIQSVSAFSNLDFSNAVLRLPDEIGEMYSLQISEGNVSQNQLMDIFYETANTIFNQKNSEQEDLYFFSSPSVSLQQPDDGTIVYPQISSGEYENKLRNESTPLDFYLFQTDTYEVHDSDEYLLMFDNLQLVKMNLGNCMRGVDKERRMAGWMPKDNFGVEQTLLPNSTEAYALLDGDVAVDQAVQFCEEYFSSVAPYREAITTFPMVHNVELMAIDDAHYGYLMLLSRSYAGIPFDSLHFEGIVSGFSDGNEYLFDNSELLMVKSDEIEYCYISNLADTITTVGEPVDEVISLKTAATAVSEMMTDYVAFQVKQISMVYSNQKATEDGLISTAQPAWRFELYNENDARTYIVIIDAQNQNGYYYCY